MARTVAYGYDPAGNRTRITWPDGFFVDYAYDALGRMTTTTASSGGVLANHGWDRLGRLATITRGGLTWGGDATSAVTLSYDALNGELEDMVHHFANGDPAGERFDYEYDAAGKLQSESAPDDWLWRPEPEDARTVRYAAANALDQYPAVDGVSLSYDLNGNRTDYGAQATDPDYLVTLHDSENRLTHAATSGMAVDYHYDADGRRVAKDFTSGGLADVDVLWAGDMEIAEYEGGSLLRRYVPGLGVDDRIAMIAANGTRSYYHAGRLGHVIAVTDSAGAIASEADRYVYTPYGLRLPPDPAGQPFRYTGRYFDAETGLFHYRARYYDPEGGRFLQTDPVGYEDQMNLYAYVRNDPLNGTDPTGKENEGLELILQELLTGFGHHVQDQQYRRAYERSSDIHERSEIANRRAAHLRFLGYHPQAQEIVDADIASRPRTTMDSSAILYTQSEYSPNFSKGGTVDDLTEQYRTPGADTGGVPPIRVFQDENGTWRTVDHRRLIAAQQAGVPIETVPLTRYELENTGAGARARTGRFDTITRRTPRGGRR